MLLRKHGAIKAGVYHHFHYVEYDLISLVVMRFFTPSQQNTTLSAKWLRGGIAHAHFASGSFHAALHEE